MTKTLQILAAFTTLSACGGGGGSTPDAVPTGLPFATENASISDFANQDIDVRVLRKTLTDDGVLETDAVLRFDETTETLTLTTDGETITFLGDPEELAGQVNVFFSTENTFSRAILALPAATLDGSAVTPTVSADAFTFGLETDPTTIDALTGEVLYQALIVGAAPRLGQEDSFGFFQGQLSITADFGTNSIGGTTLIALPGEGFDSTTVEGVINEAPIIGNGFTTGLTLTDCDNFASCRSDTVIDAKFFGPNAEELAGTAALDITLTDDVGETQNVTGAGFVSTLDDDAPN